MNNLIANLFRGYLETLSWSDKVAGLVQTASVKVDSGDAKSYPISCDLTADECKEGAYQDLMPDSRKKSIMYFEDKGVSFIERTGTRLKFKSSLRLVGWLNLRLIQEAACDADTVGCGAIGSYVMVVIRLLPTTPIHTADFISIMVTDISEPERSVDIFSRYTYSETESQYLLHPFGFFALDLQIDFTIPCVTQTSVIPLPVIQPDEMQLLDSDGIPLQDVNGNFILVES